VSQTQSVMLSLLHDEQNALYLYLYIDDNSNGSVMEGKSFCTSVWKKVCLHWTLHDILCDDQ